MKHLKDIFYIAVITLLMWISITTIIQAVKCSKMTQTELVLNIPNSCLLIFKQCNYL